MVQRVRSGFLQLALLFLLAALAATGVSSCNPATSADTKQAGNPAAANNSQPQTSVEATQEPGAEASDALVSNSEEAEPVKAEGLPRLVDFGSTTCLPCREMMPILGELTKEYEGKLIVEFVNVYEQGERAHAAGIKIIPCQVFYDKNGKELDRHMGFFPKADILAKWKELGYDFTAKAKGAAK